MGGGTPNLTPIAPPPGPNPIDQARKAGELAIRKRPKAVDRSSLVIDPAVPSVASGNGINTASAY